MKLLIFSALSLSLTLMACSNNGPKEATSTESNEQISTDINMAVAKPIRNNVADLPTFSVFDINGNIINLQDLKGKKVFVNLWASWCPPCRREMPSIEKLVNSVDSNKVRFVILSLDDNFDKARGFIKQQRLSLPIYYPAENLPGLFNVNSIPTTFIFDENGNLTKRIDGGDNYDSQEYRELLQ